MSRRPYNLPPMTALVAFESAARHDSFKTAARELNVTPAAVSHQVKALESELRCTLFHRHHRGVTLTDTGAFLMVALQRGFEAMEEATSQLRARAAGASVTIRLTTAVSALWLTPILARFWRSHGDVSVTQIVSDVDQPLADSDLSIHYGDMSRDTGLRSVLFHDRIVALGSPRFAERHHIQTLEDLAGVSLVHLETPAESRWMTWSGWFREQGLEARIEGGHRVNNYVIALQAAEDDMGAVLGWTGLTRTHVETGRLVRLLPNSVETPEDFYVKLNPRAPAGARLVYDWLLAASRGEGEAAGSRSSD